MKNTYMLSMLSVAKNAKAIIEKGINKSGVLSSTLGIHLCERLPVVRIMLKYIEAVKETGKEKLK